eukprot:TRINITY_DN1962_c0_g1_i10.p1 TRINITY_DN1962_c0_g1~~TRINITY_DN1962_c0_g1_i10.p1  ORF type:complete len:619 (-),score=77.66 TRINITY_DN1962_c0_g1_i10:179-2035(-)
MNQGFYPLDDFPIDVWQGFKMIAGYYENFQPRLLLEVINRFLHSETILTLIQTKSRAEVERLLLDSTVMASYGNFRTYRISQILWNKKPTDLLSNGSETYVAYYKRVYGLTLKELNQPLLLHVPRRGGLEIHLIPELCNLTGLTEKQRNNRAVMKSIAQHTKKTPNQMVNIMEKHLNQIESQLLTYAPLEIDKNPIVDGYRLPPPSIKVGQKLIKPERGNFLIREPILEPLVFNNWVVIYTCSSKKDFDTAEDFYQTLESAGKIFGIKVAEPHWIEVPPSGLTIQEIVKFIRKAVTMKPQIVVLLANPYIEGMNYVELYTKFKTITIKEAGIPSQFVYSNKVSDQKNSMSVCSRIVLQMNAKMGGSLWQVPKLPEIPADTMIIGADVFHKTGERRQSCVGFCATLDVNFTKYFSATHMQNVGEEIMKTVGRLVERALRVYLAENKQLPSLIIFYRDGVGDSQIDSTKSEEINLILQSFTRVNPSYNPQFAHIIVTKRISDKFFEFEEGRDGTTYRNPSSGTMVCSDIVSGSFEYFICAQNVTQGTAKPTRYQVVHNTTKLSADTFYCLTFQQCFNYYNWTGAIRTPACVQYAHKLAYLAGQTFQDQIHVNLENFLSYI